MTRIESGDAGYSTLLALDAAQRELVYGNQRYRRIEDNATVFISVGTSDLYNELGGAGDPSGGYSSVYARLTAIVNVLDYGATGDGSTDDTEAIQAALDAASKGAIVYFPEGKYKFTHLIVEKPVTLKGAGWWFGHRPTFGSAGWEAPYVTEEAGTILNCTATSGIAIDVQFNGIFSVQDLFLKGTGNNTSTTIGIKTPGGDTEEYLNGGGDYYLAGCSWERVMIGNFQTGVRMYAAYTNSFKDLRIDGCDIGLHIGHEDNHIGLNTSMFIGIDSTSCNIGLQADNLHYSTFVNCTWQGYYDTAVLLNWCTSCTFIQPYFESVTGNYSFDGDQCQSNVFINGNFGGSQNGPTKMRLGANSTGNKLICGAGFNTLTIAGYSNRVIDGSPTYITDTGSWNMFDYTVDISTTTPAATNYGRAFGMSLPDANHKGAMVFLDSDPILISPDDSKWRIKIDNSGVISGTKLT